MLSFHRSYALLTVLLAASTLGASSLLAQEAVAPTVETGVGAPLADTSGVTVAQAAPALPLAMRVASPFAETVPSTPFAVITPVDVFVVQERVRPGQNILLMTHGGAALLTGVIVGGDTGTIIATTGTVVGLVGLYRYLN
jgi:hypothetical protein